MGSAVAQSAVLAQIAMALYVCMYVCMYDSYVLLGVMLCIEKEMHVPECVCVCIYIRTYNLALGPSSARNLNVCAA